MRKVLEIFGTVRSRFLGSYAFLLFVLLLQLPVVYFVVNGLGNKYAQVEIAGDLKTRAVEMAELLDRRTLRGGDDIERLLNSKKTEFGELLGALKDESPGVESEELKSLSDAWRSMGAALDEAARSGERLASAMVEIEDGTGPAAGMLKELGSELLHLRDTSYARHIEMAGSLREINARLAFLIERYARADYDTQHIATELEAASDEFDKELDILRNGSASLGIRPASGRELDRIFGQIDSLWAERKGLIAGAVRSKDEFAALSKVITSRHLPQVAGTCERLSGAIVSSAWSGALKGMALIAASILISVACGAFFMWAINRRVLEPLGKIAGTIENFAAGDLTRRTGLEPAFMGMEAKDEVLALGRSTDRIGEQISALIGKIAETSSHLASASEELSVSAAQMSEGAGRQSSQTTQVATAMEEMNATVIEVARNSQQVSESAKAAQEIALEGGSIVSNAISAMMEVARATRATSDTIKSLDRSSEDIGTIISVINDIADQTNLLALNAAIEAARAGEQGRGFAVVADEVRKLAERTTKATKEISGMISAIQGETGKAVSAMSDGSKKVENGVSLANSAGSALKQIVTGVENVTDRIAHIATSAEEQSSTADEIARNMDSIAEVARSNAYAIEEVTKATNEMARLAGDLNELVSHFRVSSRTGDNREAPDGSFVQFSSELKAAGTI
ncbi:MAG: type IV pili methyl-accepting chemotaxis transducer N-terminal domain-containing protein [Deltaproteobacteria bacterium]|nr:type IV pili methyl-accepting chemotaxis transducer N-terminal domain-containing protein [Deltaproteobacteria bacterium]MBZ0219265.1 methyl-accepting chemotaxis protein [Deltaproteobacteria bacterium]